MRLYSRREGVVSPTYSKKVILETLISPHELETFSGVNMNDSLKYFLQAAIDFFEARTDLSVHKYRVTNFFKFDCNFFKYRLKYSNIDKISFYYASDVSEEPEMDMSNNNEEVDNMNEKDNEDNKNQEDPEEEDIGEAVIPESSNDCLPDQNPIEPTPTFETGQVIGLGVDPPAGRSGTDSSIFQPISANIEDIKVIDFDRIEKKLSFKFADSQSKRTFITSAQNDFFCTYETYSSLDIRLKHLIFNTALSLYHNRGNGGLNEIFSEVTKGFAPGYMVS